MSCCCGVSIDEAFDRLAASLPQTASLPEELPNIKFPPPAKRKRVGGVISDLDPAFIHQQLHVAGVVVVPAFSGITPPFAAPQPHSPYRCLDW